MSLQTIIEKIKIYLSEEATQEVELTDIRTQDGLILNYEGTLDVGTPINIVDAEGVVPANDGEYILEDGTKLEVLAGVVDSMEIPAQAIEAPVVAPEADVAPMMAEEVPAETESLSVEELIKKVKCLEEDNLQIKEALNLLTETLSKSNFEKEVKMSMVATPAKVVELSVEKQDIQIKKNNTLDTIFKNMYK